MKISPMDIQRQTFTPKFRGFDREEVRTYLALVAEEVAALQREHDSLAQKVQSLQYVVDEAKEREVILKNTLLTALENLRGFKSLQVHGLMVLPPFAEDPEAARPFFRRLRGLRDQATQQGLLRGAELSMGMSHDFEVAIEEGATLVRVGTAIFGERARKG